MDHLELLRAYLEEHYTQARQHETRQTTELSILTSAVGVVLGFAIHDGQFEKLPAYLFGGIVVIIGIVAILLVDAHQKGIRFHNKVAGLARKELERLVTKPEQGAPFLSTGAMRKGGFKEIGYGPHSHISAILHNRIRLIPLIIILAGAALIIAGYWTQSS